jgi:putative restriction endonuclease
MKLEKSAREEALDWFVNHTGTRVSWPAQVRSMYIVNRAKGIHKPAGSPYALSIRQTLNSRYSDSDSVTYLPDGTSEMDYAQEGTNLDLFTNRAMMACWNDDVPIGVLHQLIDHDIARYEVLGLGRIVDFREGKFKIKQFIVTDFDGSLARSSGPDFELKLDLDERTKTYREITARRGQPEFRNKLIEAYSGTCAVTGTRVVAALEAAHIVRYHGVHSNHIQNGILMRADIHTLFDIGIININPIDFRIEIGNTEMDHGYMEYQGRRLLLPESRSDWPSKQALRIYLATPTYTSIQE